MKIGISSYASPKHMKNTGASYADICDIAKRVGFDGIELLTGYVAPGSGQH